MRISDWSSDVCSSDLAERALEQARRPDRRHQRRVAAEAATVDADAILVRVALFDRPFRGVDDVVLDAFGPLLVAGIPEGLAVAARAVVIHLEQIGSASCRERVCQTVLISVVAGLLKKKN